MRRTSRPFLLLVAAIAILTAGACRSQDPPPPAPQPDFRPDASIREVMKSMVESGANALWDSVAVTVGTEGTDEEVPTSDDDWDAVRQKAIMMTEATNLLLIEGRHVAPPGARSANPGSELEPEQIEALISQNQQDWIRFVGGLHDTGLAALKAIDAHDAETLSLVGGDIDMACESCHLRFWYPEEQ